MSKLDSHVLYTLKQFAEKYDINYLTVLQWKRTHRFFPKFKAINKSPTSNHDTHYFSEKEMLHFIRNYKPNFVRKVMPVVIPVGVPYKD